MSPPARARVAPPLEAPASAPARRVPRVPWAPLLALVLVAAWWIVAPRTPDLAAQAYRVWLFEHAGFLLWDNSWYAGHHVPGYSLLFPPLASLTGMRLLGGFAVILSAWIFEALVRTLYGPATIAAALWFAVAASGDAWIGRLTFALGITFALAAALAFVRSRGRAGVRGRLLRVLAATSATLAAATSPVAGVLLVLAAASWALAGAWELWRVPRSYSPRALAPPPADGGTSRGLAWGHPAATGAIHGGAAWLLARLCARRLRSVLALIAGPLVVVFAMQALFPEGGFEPYGVTSLAATLAVALAFIVALPREERLLRGMAWIYIVVNLLGEIPTPIGANLQRYGILLAGPVLLCVLLGRRPPTTATAGSRFRRVGRAPAGAGVAGGNGHAAGTPALEEGGGEGAGASPLPRAALALVFAGMALWVLWGPVAQTREIIGEDSTLTSYYAPVKSFFARLHPAEPLRVEVPFTRAHWEAALLAPHVALARGWERQLDKRYNRALESHALTPSAYRAWLDSYGVSYVALPDVSFDESSHAEARLIGAGLPYLREVLHSANWRIFRVLHPSPLVVSLSAESPGPTSPDARARLVALGHQSFAFTASSPGRYLVKLHYTPYWQVTAGSATLREGADGFTQLEVRRAGRVAVAARFTLAGAWRALGMGL
jgi:hypothetical protein